MKLPAGKESRRYFKKQFLGNGNLKPVKNIKIAQMRSINVNDHMEAIEYGNVIHGKF
jgi:hypothetical protein